MAKKKETMSMIDSFSEFKSLKNIDRETLVKVLEESFRNVIAKMFGSDSNFDVIINPEKGDLEIWRNREVVEDGQATNAMTQVELSEALELDPDTELGEELTDQVYFEDFGRRAILNLRQTLTSKILELQKDALYGDYIKRVGQIITAEVYQVWKKEVLLLDYDGNELILPKQYLIPRDRIKKGDSVRAIIERVENNNNNPKIILSRTSNDFLKALFELEVPEIADELITIRRVARIPGERAKIAVESFDDRIDPVGACVGVKGSRIHGIVRELQNESIDVIQYTSNLGLFIQRALSPAKIASYHVNEENGHIEVYLKQDQISLAIGRGGANIKLASQLLGHEIDIFRDDADSIDEEDIYLEEFDDEIEPWVIDLLKSVGCDTAKSVLNKSREELIRVTDLEEDTIDFVLEVLRSEFEQDTVQPSTEEDKREAEDQTSNESKDL
ncbi:transcription elongation factor NusA [Porphyromonas sp. COT-108 OH2963]|uniref:Transcription termination/antitermination protein NusA n=1 Tax=Porphyromonas canoris TaxID=36875 RepID=A0ABR4XNQ4_9PORP|nr:MULTISPECIES: transcription termination factor NusA [Porphyromonas]KGN93449.1 transcription elongation factor NusA [Porphyromonas canoris]KGN95987.1 transcription elongation factor NusA [Porphyromonas sp. COT-108 OH2963]